MYYMRLNSFNRHSTCHLSFSSSPAPGDGEVVLKNHPRIRIESPFLALGPDDEEDDDLDDSEEDGEDE